MNKSLNPLQTYCVVGKLVHVGDDSTVTIRGVDMESMQKRFKVGEQIVVTEEDNCYGLTGFVGRVVVTETTSSKVEFGDDMRQVWLNHTAIDLATEENVNEGKLLAQKRKE